MATLKHITSSIAMFLAAIVSMAYVVTVVQVGYMTAAQIIQRAI